MATDLIENSQSNPALQKEVVSYGPEAGEVDIVAFKLWRHGQCFEMMDDDCECCKGAAQECLVTCP